MYQRLLELAPSPSNAFEFCLGTLAEMTEDGFYEAVNQYNRASLLPERRLLMQEWQITLTS